MLLFFVATCLDKLINKQFNFRWFETPQRSCDVIVMIIPFDYCTVYSVHRSIASFWYSYAQYIVRSRNLLQSGLVDQGNKLWFCFLSFLTLLCWFIFHKVLARQSACFSGLIFFGTLRIKPDVSLETVLSHDDVMRCKRRSCYGQSVWEKPPVIGGFPSQRAGNAVFGVLFFM